MFSFDLITWLLTYRIIVNVESQKLFYEMNDLNVNCGARLDFLIFQESLKLPPKHIWKQRRNEKETNIFTRIRNKHRYKKGSIKTLKSWCWKHVTVNSVMSNSGLSNCSPDAGLLWLDWTVWWTWSCGSHTWIISTNDNLPTYQPLWENGKQQQDQSFDFWHDHSFIQCLL